MGTVLKMYAPGDVRFDEYEEKALGPGEVRLRTLYSGISAGTELTHFRGTNPMRRRKWNEHTRLFEQVDDPGYYPRATGYEEVGEVIEMGADVADIRPGDMVYGGWTHKSTHVMNEDEAVANRLPAGLEPIQGIFAQIGAIALNGILDAGIHLGETVAIFGQGVPGLICTQLAKLSGARVIAVDLHSKRLDLAAAFGADIALNVAEGEVAGTIRELTGSRGADVCLEVSGRTEALHEAVRSCVFSGTVAALGFYQGDSPGLFLGEEFHHNRIRIVSSQINGIDPRLSNRWDMNRLRRTIMELQKDGKLRLKELITHAVAFRDAKRLYTLIDEHPGEVLQAVLRFDDREDVPASDRQGGQTG